jgi:hypothetical protein
MAIAVITTRVASVTTNFRFCVSTCGMPSGNFVDVAIISNFLFGRRPGLVHSSGRIAVVVLHARASSRKTRALGLETEGSFGSCIASVVRSPLSECGVLIKDNHEGYITWDEFERNQPVITPLGMDAAVKVIKQQAHRTTATERQLELALQ